MRTSIFEPALVNFHNTSAILLPLSVLLVLFQLLMNTQDLVSDVVFEMPVVRTGKINTVRM